MDLKKIKNLKKNQVLILFLCGVLLMIITMPVKKNESDNKTEYMDNYESSRKTAMTDSTEYTQYLERQLEDMLSQMEGAGNVSCMITLSSSAEQVIEKDMEVSDHVVNESDSQGGIRTTNQSSRSETTIYNEEENGSPYVSKEILPKIEGVLVIADGGDNAVVVKNITDSLQALFGIESHKIRIVKKGGAIK